MVVMLVMAVMVIAQVKTGLHRDRRISTDCCSGSDANVRPRKVSGDTDLWI